MSRSKVNPAELLRTDAVGNRAVRRRFEEVVAEQRRAKNKLEEWNRELLDYVQMEVETPSDAEEKARGERNARQKVALWGARLRHADHDYEELRERVVHAWD